MRNSASRFIVFMFLAVVVALAAFLYRPGAGRSAAQVLGDTIVRTSSVGNANGNNGNGVGHGGSTSDTGPHSFRIVGSFNGLYPGVNGILNVTVSNDESFAIVVQSVSATVASVDSAHSACPLSIAPARPTVIVTALTSAFQIAKNGSAQKQLAITMDDGAPDACSGATFTLQYGGSASKANQ